jgi:hypothetical protein
MDLPLSIDAIPGCALNVGRCSALDPSMMLALPGKLNAPHVVDRSHEATDHLAAALAP